MPRGKRYSDEERELILHFVAQVAPMDPKGWTKVKRLVFRRLCKLLGTNGTPTRTARSVQKQYRAMTKNPTALSIEQQGLVATAQEAILAMRKQRQSRATVFVGVHDVHHLDNQRNGHGELDDTINRNAEGGRVVRYHHPGHNDNRDDDDDCDDDDDDDDDDDIGDDEGSGEEDEHNCHSGHHMGHDGLIGMHNTSSTARHLHLPPNPSIRGGDDRVEGDGDGDGDGTGGRTSSGGVRLVGLHHHQHHPHDNHMDTTGSASAPNGNVNHNNQIVSHLSQDQQQQQQQQQHAHLEHESHSRLQPRDVSFSSNASVATVSSMATRRTARTIGTGISLAGVSASGAVSFRGGSGGRTGASSERGVSRMRWADAASLAGGAGMGGGGQSSGGEGMLDSSISVSAMRRRKRKKARHASFHGGGTESSEVAALRQRVAQLEQHAEEHRQAERRWASELLGLQASMAESRNRDQQDRMRELAELRAFFISLLGRMAQGTDRATDVDVLSARMDETEAQLHQRLNSFQQSIRQQQQQQQPQVVVAQRLQQQQHDHISQLEDPRSVANGGESTDNGNAEAAAAAADPVATGDNTSSGHDETIRRNHGTGDLLCAQDRQGSDERPNGETIASSSSSIGITNVSARGGDATGVEQHMDDAQGRGELATDAPLTPFPMDV